LPAKASVLLRVRLQARRVRQQAGSHRSGGLSGHNAASERASTDLSVINVAVCRPTLSRPKPVPLTGSAGCLGLRIDRRSRLAGEWGGACNVAASDLTRSPASRHPTGAGGMGAAVCDMRQPRGQIPLPRDFVSLTARRSLLPGARRLHPRPNGEPRAGSVRSCRRASPQDHRHPLR
jgi:hypothetical protein